MYPVKTQLISIKSLQRAEAEEAPHSLTVGNKGYLCGYLPLSAVFLQPMRAYQLIGKNP